MRSYVRISIHQRKALEKITGKPWNIWNSLVIEAYFAFTDTGKQITLSENLKTEFEELMSCHRSHAYTIECWREDFRSGLLSLWDFLNEGYPEPYIEHVFEVYEETTGFIPACYQKHKNCPERFSK